MSVLSGIHVFYSAKRDNWVSLYHLRFNGATVTLNDKVPLTYKNWTGSGASAVLANKGNTGNPLDDGINIQCTMSGSHNVHFIRYQYYNNAWAYYDYGPILGNGGPVMQSQDRTAAILVSPDWSEQIWYREQSSGNLWFQSSGSACQVFMGSGQPMQINYGPAAAYEGAAYVAVNQNKTATLFCMYGPGDATYADISPPSTTLSFAPALVKLSHDSQIMLLHRSEGDIWGQTNGLFYNIYDIPQMSWSGDQFVSQFASAPVVDAPAFLKNSPGACVFGARVYCFFQHTDGTLYLQVYMGDRWMIDAVQVTDSNAPIANMWYGPCAVAP